MTPIWHFYFCLWSLFNNLTNYERRHSKLSTNCHVSWDTLYLRSIPWAGNFWMVDIRINAWYTLFLNLQIKLCLFSLLLISRSINRSGLRISHSKVFSSGQAKANRSIHVVCIQEKTAEPTGSKLLSSGNFWKCAKSINKSANVFLSEDLY